MRIRLFTRLAVALAALSLGACQKSRVGQTKSTPSGGTFTPPPVASTNSAPICSGPNCAKPCEDTAAVAGSIGNFWETPIFRFKRISGGGFLYQTSPSADSSQWNVEGVKFYLYKNHAADTKAVYSCHDKAKDEHWLSSDSNCGVAPEQICCANKGASCGSVLTNAKTLGYAYNFQKQNSMELYDCDVPPGLASTFSSECSSASNNQVVGYVPNTVSRQVYLQKLPVGQSYNYREELSSTSGGWTATSFSFKVFAGQLPGTVPLYRCSTSVNGNPIYMSSLAANCEVWNKPSDMVLGYVYPAGAQPTDSQALYRCYNPTTQAHHMSNTTTCLGTGATVENNGQPLVWVPVK